MRGRVAAGWLGGSVAVVLASAACVRASAGPAGAGGAASPAASPAPVEAATAEAPAWMVVPAPSTSSSGARAEQGWTARRQGTARWTEVEYSERCYFLSGPATLGLYTSLEGTVMVRKDAEQVRLVFESGAEFVGTTRGERWTLERHAPYQHANAPWRADEQLEGTSRAGILRARYVYRECDLSGREGCPGRCTIEATLELNHAAP